MADPVESALDSIGWGPFQMRLLLLCAVGYFATCSELLLAVFLEEPLSKQFHLTPGQYAWFPVTVSVCSFLASLAAGTLADLYGRRLVFAISLLLVGLAGLLCALSASFPAIIALRSVVGAGTGSLAVVDYVIFQEFTPRAARGRYLYAVFAAGCLGVLYLAAIAAFSNLEWQWLVVLAALPTLPAGLLRCLLTLETPQYLAATGRQADAYAVLRCIGEMNNTSHQLPDEPDFLQASNALRSQMASRGKLAAVLHSSQLHLTAPLAVIWLLQSTAYWGLTLFLPNYLVAVGMPPNRTIFAMVACEVPGCIMSALLIEHPRIGRLGTLRANYIVASLAAIVLGVLGQGTEVLALLACLVYFSMIPNWAVLFIFTPEAYPTQFRGTALGLFQTIQGIPSIFSPFLSASLVTKGDAYMLAWAGCLVGALLASAALQRSPAISSTNISDDALVSDICSG